MYMRFMIWLPANGVESGWKGCLSYATELAAWNKQLGFSDTRSEIEFWWDTFRLNFKNMIIAFQKHAKLPLRAPMLLLLLDSLDLSHLPHGRLTDKIVSTKIANIAVGNFGIDRASEAADAPQDKQHTEVLQLRISLGDGKKLSHPPHP